MTGQPGGPPRTKNTSYLALIPGRIVPRPRFDTWIGGAMTELPAGLQSAPMTMSVPAEGPAGPLILPQVALDPCFRSGK